MGDSSFNAYFTQYNMQGTRILFSKVSAVQSAQNLIEITPAVVIDLIIRSDLRSFVN